MPGTNPRDASTDAVNLLTVPEFCARNKLSRSHFYALAGRGEIELLKIGVLTRVSVEAERAWLAGLRTVRGVA